MVEKLLRASFVLFVLLGSLVLPISAAQACTCAMGTPKDQLNRADAVFTGDIVDKRGDLQRVVYTIEVDRVYKGQVLASQEVVTSGDGASCGITLPRRYPVTIFASGQPFGSHLDDGQLATSMCSGSGSGTSVPVGFGVGEPQSRPRWLTVCRFWTPARQAHQVLAYQ